MVTEQSVPPSRQVAQLRNTVSQLQQTVRLMEEQRQRAIDQRRRRLAIIGGSCSLLFHIALMIYLGLVYRGGGSAVGDTGDGSYELAILNEADLTQLEETAFDEVETEAANIEQISMETSELTAVAPAAAQFTATAGSLPTLGGAGGSADGDMGLGGGGGGTTSFFGIGSKGTRFAYIVDVSGSMGQNRRLEIAKRELTRSIDALPDYAYFYVLLFSNDFVQPPNQKSWMRSRKAIVRQVISWLTNSVDPGGGTQPRTSFMQVFSLEERPDVIYFLTDGEFNDITAEEIADMNRRGKRAVIHTIQFGDRNGEEVLRQIAKRTGGVYRFVASEGG